MNEPFLCAMATFDAETEEKISGFRRQLLSFGFTGRQSKHLPPHITLGIFRPEQKEDAKLCTQKAAEHSKAFSLFFRHIGIFSGANVLFLAPDRTEELLFLHSFFGTAEEFAPHVTLLSDKPSSVYAALPYIADAFHPFQGMVSDIQLYKFHPAKSVLSVTLKNNTNMV